MSAPSRPPAVLLAGGLSRRLGGGDKALLDLGGRPVLAHAVARLAPQAGPLAISANGDPARFAAFGLPVLPDPVPDRPGPLAGVLAALLWAGSLGAPHALVVPGDSPWLPADLVPRLLGAGAPSVAASGGRTHPVVGLWPVALAPRLRAVLDAGRRRVMAFAEEAGAAVVEFPVPPEGDPFADLDTPADLAAARARP